MKSSRLLCSLFVVFLLAVPAAASVKPALLRLDGLGPLKLAMTRTSAVNTGWLAHKGTGCPLGGPPIPISYRVNGAKAPAGVNGNVEFVNGKLSDMSFTGGVRTATGVVVGKSTVAQMLSSYRHAGFAASSRYDATFGVTFVTVKRNGKVVLQGLAAKKTIQTLAIPAIQLCE
jgi:hypothetical protein